MTTSQKQKISVLIVAFISMILYGVYLVSMTSAFETKWVYIEYDSGYKLVSYKQGINDGKTYISIPSQYKGKNVVAIADKAFYKNKRITTVIVPDTVKEMGSSVFKGCRDLRNVILGDNLTVMGGACFKNCESLVSLVLPESLTEVRGETFMGCSSLKGVKLPSNITEIKGETFKGCSALENIEIPDGVTRIAGYAFMGCSSLKSIKLPSNITEIRGYTFNGCSALESIEIPDGVTRIGAYAFYECSSLTDVLVPDTVREIGSSAFRRCESLEKIELPKRVYIDASAFKESPAEISEREVPYELIDDIKAEINNITSFESVYVLCDKNKEKDEYFELIYPNTIHLINNEKFAKVMSTDYKLKEFADAQELVDFLNEVKERDVDTIKWFLYSNIASENLGHICFATCKQSIDTVIKYQSNAEEQNGGPIDLSEDFRIIRYDEEN